jgi:hypothetical protein
MQKSILIVGIIMIMATGFLGFRYGDDKNSFDITYEVLCKDCTVTYRDEMGNSAEVHGVQDNWSFDFTGKPGQFVYVSATNPDGSETQVVIKRGGNELIKGKSLEREHAARAGSIL